MPDDVLDPRAGSGAASTERGFHVRPLSPFGAEVVGLDLERPLDDATVKALWDLWLDAGILLFRGGVPSQEAHMRLSRCFGTLQASATDKLNLKDNPCIMGLRQTPGDKSSSTYAAYETGGRVRTGWLGWHWDQSFTSEIVRGAVLRMLEPARLDGRTGFIDAVAAWERLPESLQRRIADLEVVYHFTGAQEANRFGFPEDLRLAESAAGRDEAVAGYRVKFPPVVHPMVITQVETGRKVLKLSPMHAQYILGMPREESDALLTEVAGYLVDEQYAYFHTWQVNDAIVWDNWRIIHSATGVPLDCARYAERTTLVGDYKLGRFLDPDDADKPKTYLAD